MAFLDYIYSVDLFILNFIQDTLRCAFLDGIMWFFSCIGEMGALWIVTAAVFLCFKNTRLTGIMVLSALLLGFVSGELIMKNLIARPRPFVDFSEIAPLISPPSSYSFPSGHSCSSFAAATVISLRNKKLAVPALLTAFLIAFSRVYNCVHYPSDVLCGILLGILCAVTIIIIFKRLQIKEEK